MSETLIDPEDIKYIKQLRKDSRALQEWENGVGMNDIKFTDFELNILARTLHDSIVNRMNSMSACYDDSYLFALKDEIELYEKLSPYRCDEME